jgi:hypothetical protein
MMEDTVKTAMKWRGSEEVNSYEMAEDMFKWQRW